MARLRTIRDTDNGALWRGLAAYGSAELATRVVRIVVVVVIARRISPEMMGVAALALSQFEIVRVLAGAGIGQRVVAAPEALLAATCNTAHRLFWVWCGAVAAVQLALAAALAWGFAQPQVGAMLAVLSGVYLLMPGGLVQVFLLMREGRLSTTARIAASQTLADHLLTMVLVLAWPSAWMIVLPKLLTAPVWLLQMRRARPWRHDDTAGTVPVAGFVAFGVGVLVTEVSSAIRQQADKLIVGALLGVKALGIYYFAFNAGLGITTSFVTAFGTVVFPMLCRAAEGERAARLRAALGFGLVIFLPVTLAQVVLAPVYVPLLFGTRWASAAGLVSILGLAAAPMIFAAALTAWHRATGRTGTDAVINAVAGAAGLFALAAGCVVGLHAAAAAYVAAYAVVVLPAACFIFARASRPSHPVEELTDEPSGILHRHACI